jgi:hypothetical protein
MCILPPKKEVAMLRSLALAILSCSYAASTAVAAEPVTGDEVHVKWAGKDIAAEVVEVNPRTKWVKVRFEFNGLVLTPTLPPDKVFTDSKTLQAADDKKEQELLELLSTNSDGKNVSSPDQRPWHAPGKAGQKFGPLLGTARVKAYRAGSRWFVLESTVGEKKVEKTLQIEEICNEDRKYLFGLLKKR